MAAVSKNARVCERCGAPVESTSAGDLGCVACLLGAGLDVDGPDSEAPFTIALAQLGAYTIERHPDGSAWELGRGAMGVTYRAIDKALDRSVALKIIKTDHGSRSAEARERFMREARAAAALRHPNVATVYQFGVCEETGQFFYAMELVEGETLEERIRRLGPFDVLTTLDIALQVTAALEAAEERGLVHRDLKPGNLMLVNAINGDVAAPKVGRVLRASQERAAQRAAPTVKVIDFGVAKAIADKTNAMALTHGGFVGTPAFASPEQFTNAPVDVRSDIYSLGATLWFLLTGHMLFSGGTVEDIQDARRSKPLPTEQLKAARVPRRLISLLTSMLAIEPAARPAGAHALSARLQAIRSAISSRRKTAARLGLAAAVVALTTIVAVRVFHSSAIKETPVPIPEKSIAVLPFENLGGDPNNAYFAQGMQEEILTRLAKIADLKVISRTSTQRYHSKPDNLAEIAKQLGVANILEGSVQKAADQVRVDVQLINAQTDSQLWADSYDRTLTNILGVESEIAKRIAESLQAKLTGREEQALAAKPTNNAEAYAAYLHGLALDVRTVTGSNEGNSTDSYKRAVQLDPNFALALARLSRAAARAYDISNVPADRDAAKRALDTTQKLEPNSPETLLALGDYQLNVLLDFGAAKTTYERVSEMLPGSGEAVRAVGRVVRVEGHLDQSVPYYERALALDPRNIELLTVTALNYEALRQFPTALKLLDRVLDIAPNDGGATAVKVTIYQAQGNLREAARCISRMNPRETGSVLLPIQLRLERHYAEAIQFEQAVLAQLHFDSQEEKAEKPLFQRDLALMQRIAGDTAGAKVTAEQLRNTLEPLCRDKPDDLNLTAILSFAYALLGEKDLALKLAEHAVMLKPRAKYPFAVLQFEEKLAVIQTLVGENSRAISILTELLRTPYNGSFYCGAPITPILLRLDPFWDPLRSDPAFQKLCEEKQDLTTNGH